MFGCEIEIQRFAEQDPEIGKPIAVQIHKGAVAASQQFTGSAAECRLIDQLQLLHTGFTGVAVSHQIRAGDG